MTSTGLIVAVLSEYAKCICSQSFLLRIVSEAKPEAKLPTII